ncbi:MAG: hypothetical protein COS84_07050 [Armatimonadetes bacterium CG07_land_8_20_14_0_80_40_9]|nr:MAG: hypothetical protein COS84_07050 [Armatimonadetes bacterium CG07_land_8_20_14_0_80_40_9]
MIKNPKEYREESERERKEYLRALTLLRSIQIMESLLDSELIDSLSFSSDLPVCSKIGLKNENQ